MNESSEIRGSGATFRYQDRMNMRIGVSRSDTRIVYGSGATFDTRIVYEDRSATFRHQDSMRSGVSRTNTRGIKIMNLAIC